MRTADRPGEPAGAFACPGINASAPRSGAMGCCVQSATAHPQHADEHRSKCAVFHAVDQELGEGPFREVQRRLSGANGLGPPYRTQLIPCECESCNEPRSLREFSTVSAAAVLNARLWAQVRLACSLSATASA